MSTGKRLLIVDDSRLILRMVKDFFTPHGWDVAEAEDGEAALGLIAQTPPDVVVADVLMPRMDGWTLLEEVRRRPEGSEMPFVFLTTEADLPQRLEHLGRVELLQLGQRRLDGLRRVADDLSEARRRIQNLEGEIARLRSATTAGDARMNAVESQVADGIARAAERIERLARALNPTQPPPSA